MGIHEASGLWFVCMAEKGMGRRLPFAFLAAVQEAFLQTFTADQVESAIAYAMQGNFREELKLLMERYNSPDADRVVKLSEKVRHINDQLMESIDKILMRQQQIELLVNQSRLLDENSGSFQRHAQGLHESRKEWWRNRRTLGLLALVVTVTLLLLMLTRCGIRFESC